MNAATVHLQKNIIDYLAKVGEDGIDYEMFTNYCHQAIQIGAVSDVDSLTRYITKTTPAEWSRAQTNQRYPTVAGMSVVLKTLASSAI